MSARFEDVVASQNVGELDAGLTNDDVFYFGNAIGETGNNSGNAIVNLTDVGFTRENQSGFSTVDIT